MFVFAIFIYFLIVFNSFSSLLSSNYAIVKSHLSSCQSFAATAPVNPALSAVVETRWGNQLREIGISRITAEAKIPSEAEKGLQIPVMYSFVDRYGEQDMPGVEPSEFPDLAAPTYDLEVSLSELGNITVRADIAKHEHDRRLLAAVAELDHLIEAAIASAKARRASWARKIGCGSGLRPTCG
jgi:hypothetical protein